MGTGKPILSISMAMDFGREVLVFMYTSLVNIHINDIKQYLSMMNFNDDNDSCIKS